MQSFPPDDSPRRNYIRRKKCLNESINIIEKTLLCLSSIRKDKIDKSELTKLAKAHANEVEAACWTPRMKMSDDDYQNLMNSKTKELCLVLIKKLMPAIDTTQKKSEISSPASSPQENKFVVPIIGQTQMLNKQNQQKPPQKQTIPLIQPQRPASAPMIDPLADFAIPIKGLSEPYYYMPSFEQPPSIDDFDLHSLEDIKDVPSFSYDLSFPDITPYDVDFK